jgi:hypothetical protein
MPVIRPISTVSRNVIFFLASAVCFARCNKCIVGNENDLLGLLYGNWGGGVF